MGTKFSKRLVAVLIALVMVMASAMTVFAVGGTPSADQGVKSPTIVNLGTTDSYASKWFNFKWRSTDADYHVAFMREEGGAWQSARTAGYSMTKVWRGLKDGGFYQFKAEAWNTKNKASSTISYRWMKTANASAKASKGYFTVKWPKVAKADRYQVQWSKNSNMSGAQSAIVYGTSKKISVGKGTWYYRVRPLRGSYLGIFNGIQSTNVK